MEPGAIGERIRVLNPTSHAVVEAEVIGPDRVRVAPSAVPSDGERAMKRQRASMAPALACLLLVGLRVADPAVGGRARAGDDADRGSDQGPDLAAGDHADAGPRADTERGERAVAVRARAPSSRISARRRWATSSPSWSA